MIDQKRLEQIIGGTNVEDDLGPRSSCDNLAVALASYFEDHMDRPEDDEHDEELGWGVWVIEKTNAAIALIAKEVLEEIRCHNTTQTPLSKPE